MTQHQYLLKDMLTIYNKEEIVSISFRLTIDIYNPGDIFT